jgi:hypothetical protein
MLILGFKYILDHFNMCLHRYDSWKHSASWAEVTIHVAVTVRMLYMIFSWVSVTITHLTWRICKHRNSNEL